MAAIILFFYEDVLKKYLGDGIMRAMLVFYGPRILCITTGSVRKRCSVCVCARARERVSVCVCACERKS